LLDQADDLQLLGTGIAPALFAGGWALEQLWLFWLAPRIP
jgi:hypothetical protein